MPRPGGGADDLHYILDSQYVIRHPDGSAEKSQVRDKAQLVALLTGRFGLRLQEKDMLGLDRYLIAAPLGQTAARAVVAAPRSALLLPSALVPCSTAR